MIVGKLNNTTMQGGYTVPQPFELSHSHAVDKKSKLAKELKEKEMQQCTFKPNTNEGRNRKIIKEILEEADKENDLDESNLRYQEQRY